MELLSGHSLKDRLASGAMSIEEILEIGIQVAGALTAAHGQGIMHRDITPGNIFLTGTGVVKLLDFGLAKHFGSSDDGGMTTEDLTQTGVALGTVHYMAPEHFLESSPLDHRCDLFSFGAVLYQMATGARPFEARTKSDVVSLILEQPHIPLRQLAPHQPPQLEHIVEPDRHSIPIALGAAQFNEFYRQCPPHTFPTLRSFLGRAPPIECSSL